MAKYDYSDKILKLIASEALNFLQQNVTVNRIKCILVTGSIANGEGTVIKNDSCLTTSDFDFVVYLDFPYYLKTRNHFRNLSQIMTTRLRNKKVNTHIVFFPSTRVLQTGINFIKSSIYEYEFAMASKCVFGVAPSFNKTARPSERDALELLFTVISDLVFLKIKEVSKIEETYLYAKRALTLLNSILILHGVYAETYEKRIRIAKEYTSRRKLPLTRDQIKTLETFTQFKLTGSFQQFINSLAYNRMDDLLDFQREFLKKLTKNILYQELDGVRARVKNGQIKLKYYDSYPNSTYRLLSLLKGYSKFSRTRILSRILGITLFLVWSLARDDRRKELFATFIFHKQPPKVILNVIIALQFLYEFDISLRKILNYLFPWIELNEIAEAEGIQKFFYLWQIAEQSIKL
jgi:hypothetical protein